MYLYIFVSLSIQPQLRTSFANKWSLLCLELEENPAMKDAREKGKALNKHIRYL